MDEGAGPVGAGEPGHEAMTRKLKPKVRWPDLHTSPETWSNAELRGVSINPVATGIGRHPRSISDEDWVLRCERDIEDNGLAQFLTDLLHILRLTVPKYLGEPQPVGDYPPATDGGRSSACPMFLTRVIAIGTRTAGTRRWSAASFATRCWQEFRLSRLPWMSRLGSQLGFAWSGKSACGSTSSTCCTS